MSEVQKENKLVGDFLVENGIINQDQMNQALLLQKDNAERLIGEVIVSLGFLSKEDMIMALEMYLMTTDTMPTHVDEWLDQEEIDLIMGKINSEGKSS